MFFKGPDFGVFLFWILGASPVASWVCQAGCFSEASSRPGAPTWRPSSACRRGRCPAAPTGARHRVRPGSGRAAGCRGRQPARFLWKHLRNLRLHGKGPGNPGYLALVTEWFLVGSEEWLLFPKATMKPVGWIQVSSEP